MEKAWKVGRLAFVVRGNHPIAGLLREEFDSLPTTEESPRLIIDVQDRLPEPEGEKIHLGDSLYFAGQALNGTEKRAGYSFAVGGLDRQNGPRHVLVSCRPGTVPASRFQALGHWLDKRRNWNFLSRAERVAKDILYDLINPMLHISMLPLGQGFCHASAVVGLDGDAVVFTGTGGAGKTGLVLSLLHLEDWRYLSDDLLAVDEEGEAHAYPMKMQIYGYNTLGNAGLSQRVLRDRPWDDLWQWRLRLWLHGPRKVRRRIAAKVLFDEKKLAGQARLRHVYFLARAQTASLRIEDITPQELARRSAHIIMYEHRKFLEKVNLCALESATLDTAAIFQQSQAVYEKCFSKARCHRATIPSEFTPVELYTALKSHMVRNGFGAGTNPARVRSR
jgi:hypothetical protein